MELFQIHPLDFLVKPFESRQIEKILDAFLEISREGEKLFQYQSGQNLYRLPFSDILYFTSEGRQIRLQTVKEGTYPSFYGKLEQIRGQLNDSFILVHKSYIVNQRYIRQYNYESVIMMNGEEINISRTHRKEIRDKVIQLWRKQGGHE